MKTLRTLPTQTDLSTPRRAGRRTHRAKQRSWRRYQISNPLAEKTRLAYNPAGQVTRITDALGNISQLTYALAQRGHIL